MTEAKDLSVKIINELYRTVEILGGDMTILAYIGSFRDTMSDQTILNEIQGWNEGKTVALKKMLR